MSIAVMAFRSSITIAYASESIGIHPVTGTPRIVVDLLFRNDHSDPISELCCLTEHAIFGRDGSLLKPPSFMEDSIHLSSDLTLIDTPFTDATEATRRTMTRRGLTLPNPTDPTRDIEYRGTVSLSNRVLPFTASPEQRVLLSVNRLGAFRIVLDPPVQPEESRWIRLHVRATSGPLEERSRGAQLIDILRGNLTFTYLLSGPADVSRDVVRRLAVFHREVIDAGDSPVMRKIESNIEDLERRLVREGIDSPGTFVRYDDWRVRVFRGALDPFGSIQTEGAARVSGTQPNLIARQGREAYYEWCSGRTQVAPPPTCATGSFRIRFVTRSQLIRIEPWMGLVTAVLSLVAGLALILGRTTLLTPRNILIIVGAVLIAFILAFTWRVAAPIIKQRQESPDGLPHELGSKR